MVFVAPQLQRDLVNIRLSMWISLYPRSFVIWGKRRFVSDRVITDGKSLQAAAILTDEESFEMQCAKWPDSGRTRMPKLTPSGILSASSKLDPNPLLAVWLSLDWKLSDKWAFWTLSALNPIWWWCIMAEGKDEDGKVWWGSCRMDKHKQIPDQSQRIPSRFEAPRIWVTTTSSFICIFMQAAYVRRILPSVIVIFEIF